jgi:pimeloyl-ACP methyl ester carboxylesterase
MNNFTLLLFLLLLSCSSTGPVELSQQERGEKLAEQFINYFLTKQEEDAHHLCSPKLQEEMRLVDLQKLQADLIEQHGELVKIDQSFYRQKQARFIIAMELSTLVIEVNLNEKNQISGFWKLYVEDRSERKKLTTINSFDGFKLPVKISKPKSVSSDKIESVVIFIHGSGPNDLNGSDQQLFHHLSTGMVKNGVATLRYNKRSFEVRRKLSFDPRYKSSDEHKKFDRAPYRFFIKDANHMVNYAKELFPNANVILLGHSQGTGIALQVAHRNRKVTGTVLVGFTTTPIYVSAFEQELYRHLDSFYQLDKNRDNQLSNDELQSNKAVLSRLAQGDLNQDALISQQEFKGALISNFILKDYNVVKELTVEELRLPSPADILRRAKFKVLFFQGELDHQTQAYHAKAIENANNAKWKKDNFKFIYLPSLGHNLNFQNKFLEFNYTKVQESTVSKVVEALGFLTEKP